MHFVETKQTVTQHNLVVNRKVFQQYWPGFQCFCRSSFISVNSCLSLLTSPRIGHGLTSLYPETPQKFCELRSRDLRLLKSVFLIQDLADLFGWCVCVVVNVLSCSDFLIFFFLRFIRRSESGESFHTVTAESISATFPALVWKTGSTWQVGAFQIYFSRWFWISAKTEIFWLLSTGSTASVCYLPLVGHLMLRGLVSRASLVSIFSTIMKIFTRESYNSIFVLYLTVTISCEERMFM